MHLLSQTISENGERHYSFIVEPLHFDINENVQYFLRYSNPLYPKFNKSKVITANNTVVSKSSSSLVLLWKKPAGNCFDLLKEADIPSRTRLFWKNRLAISVPNSWNMSRPRALVHRTQNRTGLGWFYYAERKHYFARHRGLSCKQEQRYRCVSEERAY